MMEYHVHDAVLLLAAWQVKAQKHTVIPAPQFPIGQPYFVRGFLVDRCRRDVTAFTFVLGRGCGVSRARSTNTVQHLTLLQ